MSTVEQHPIVATTPPERDAALVAVAERDRFATGAWSIARPPGYGADPATPLFSIVEQAGEDPAAAYLFLSGELCMYSAPLLGEALDTVIERGVTDVGLDLADLRLCTADGINVIEGARDQLAAGNGTVALTRPRGIVDRVLKLTAIPASPKKPSDPGSAPV